MTTTATYLPDLIPTKEAKHHVDVSERIHYLHRLTPAARQVLAAITFRTNVSAQWSCWQSVSDITKLTGIKRRNTIHDALNLLETAGYLVRTSPTEGHKKSNSYQLTAALFVAAKLHVPEGLPDGRVSESDTGSARVSVSDTGRVSESDTGGVSESDIQTTPLTPSTNTTQEQHTEVDTEVPPTDAPLGVDPQDEENLGVGDWEGLMGEDERGIVVSTPDNATYVSTSDNTSKPPTMTEFLREYQGDDLPKEEVSPAKRPAIVPRTRPPKLFHNSAYEWCDKMTVRKREQHRPDEVPFEDFHAMPPMDQLQYIERVLYPSRIKPFEGPFKGWLKVLVQKRELFKPNSMAYDLWYSLTDDEQHARATLRDPDESTIVVEPVFKDTGGLPAHGADF